MAAVVMAAALAACGGGGGGPEAKGPDRSIVDGARRTVPVQVDARPEGFAASFHRFFPDQVNVHPGDTLRFTSMGTGEPHTVAGGTVVDEWMSELAKDPEGAEAKERAAKVPTFLPPLKEMAEKHDGEPLQAAAQPCFLGDDDPPLRGACPEPQQEQPETFTGAPRFYNSGFLPDGTTFDVRLDDRITAGTYSFLSLLHGSRMRLVVNVVEPETATPAPEEVAATARAQLDDFTNRVRPQVEALRANASLAATAGAFPEDQGVPAILNVVPTVTRARVGETVRWTIFGYHTISFNAPPDIGPFYAFDDKGEVHANPRIVAPAQSQDHPDYPFGRDPRLEYRLRASQFKRAEHVLKGADWDGSGFLSSGVELLTTADPNQDLVYELTFTKRGTYAYGCLVHPGMTGTVEVR